MIQMMYEENLLISGDEKVLVVFKSFEEFLFDPEKHKEVHIKVDEILYKVTLL